MALPEMLAALGGHAPTESVVTDMRDLPIPALINQLVPSSPRVSFDQPGMFLASAAFSRHAERLAMNHVAQVAVPEPMSLILLGAGLVCLPRRPGRPS